MRILKDVRNLNKREDFLFEGMEDIPRKMSSKLYNEQLEFYKKVIKPNVRKISNKYI